MENTLYIPWQDLESTDGAVSNCTKHVAKSRTEIIEDVSKNNYYLRDNSADILQCGVSQVDEVGQVQHDERHV